MKKTFISKAGRIHARPRNVTAAILAVSMIIIMGPIAMSAPSDDFIKIDVAGEPFLFPKYLNPRVVHYKFADKNGDQIRDQGNLSLMTTDLPQKVTTRGADEIRVGLETGYRGNPFQKFPPDYPTTLERVNLPNIAVYLV